VPVKSQPRTAPLPKTLPSRLCTGNCLVIDKEGMS
jgi:hypothetical protein